MAGPSGLRSEYGPGRGGLGLAYQWDGEAYQRHSSYQLRAGLALLELLNLRDGESILDVGCGNGLLTLELADRVPTGTVLGIDSSASMLAQAENNRHRAGQRNLTFRQQDALDLAEEGEFDAIYSNAALHWIFDQDRLLGRFRQALKPNGRLVIGLGGRGNAAPLYELLDRLIQTPRYGHFFADWEFPWYLSDERTYRVLMERSGFRDIRIETRQIPVAYDSTGFQGWFATTHLPYISRIPEGLREAFTAEVTEAYRRLAGSDELILPFVRLIVQARR